MGRHQSPFGQRNPRQEFEVLRVQSALLRFACIMDLTSSLPSTAGCGCHTPVTGTGTPQSVGRAAPHPTPPWAACWHSQLPQRPQPAPLRLEGRQPSRQPRHQPHSCRPDRSVPPLPTCRSSSSSVSRTHTHPEAVQQHCQQEACSPAVAQQQC